MKTIEPMIGDWILSDGTATKVSLENIHSVFNLFFRAVGEIQPERIQVAAVHTEMCSGNIGNLFLDSCGKHFLRIDMVRKLNPDEKPAFGLRISNAVRKTRESVKHLFQFFAIPGTN